MTQYAESSSENAKQSFEERFNEYFSKETVYADPADKQKAWDDTVSAATAYISALQSEIDLYKEALANSINSIWEESAKSLTGKNLGLLDAEWNRELEQSSKYLDDISKAYEIKNFESTVQEKINKLTNKNSQAKITAELEAQLEAMRAMEKLSKEDLARAERKIQLIEAEIALEEARNNKSQMKLVRGADGVYSYQYVTDQNAISEAERNYESIK
jgi:hypothetical protein